MYTDIDSFCVSAALSVQETIVKMNTTGLGIVLLVDEERFLLGIVTDGDIRRAVLGRFDLKLPVQSLLETKKGTKYVTPLFAYEGEDKEVYLTLLKTHRLSHLPILDRKNRVAGLVTSDEFVMGPLSSLHAVVMAGGKGTRLLPLTEDLPKPMLRVGEKPLLEIIIGKLRQVGIQRVNITTHHKPEKIREHFGDGRDFGIDLNYVAENTPLGTAGALGLLEGMDKTTLLINGDILTDVDFRAMLQFHREHQADLTVGIRSYESEVPYGVIECEGVVVKKVREKPKFQVMVNAGIYLLEPNVYRFIPPDCQYNMTDLIDCLIREKLIVVSFPIHEYWLDIGVHAEYEQAQEELKKRNSDYAAKNNPIV